MEATDLQFLQALQASLRDEQVNWDETVDWVGLFRLAQKHQVLPLIYEAVHGCLATRLADPGVLDQARRQSVRTVMTQTMKTREFLELYAHLRSQGLKPLVVKGLVCRELYPRPDHRISADEDLLIPWSQFDACRNAMTQWGMTAGPMEEDPWELPFRKSGSPLYIELHRSLFPPASEAYGDLNRFFTNVHTNAVWIRSEGVEVKTLGPSDHLFYLICHAFKHFLHSGFGLRQVCDITLYANAWGSQIDWTRLLDQCRWIRAEKFTAAIFRMGEKYLTFDPARACYPACWGQIEVDEGPMLADLLDAGLYGDGNLTRKHSATMTLSAVAAQKQGRKANGVLRSLFPPAGDLEGRYPYLKKQPWLLPVAWTQRIAQYHGETRKGGENDAASSVKLGNARIALMKQYGILD